MCIRDSNQISGSGAAVDANGDPLLDSNGNPITGSDLSDSGNDPGSTNPDDPFDGGTSADVTGFDPPPLPLGEISGSVFIDQDGNGIFDPGEEGIPGVEITLLGTDTYGDPVNIVVFTDANGGYSFTDLNAGNYRVIETQPQGFSDGAESGAAQFIVGDDEFSGIVLNWGQSFTANTFGEQLGGTSGFPPSFPTLPPINATRISDLIDGFLGTPSPIYSGVAIGSNARPLGVMSGRPIGGGYSGDGTIDAVEAVECDPCAELPVQESMIVEEPIVEDCGCEGEEVVEDVVVAQEPVAEDCEVVSPEVCDPAPDCEVRPKFLGGSFLKRMSNWLKR